MEVRRIALSANEDHPAPGNGVSRRGWRRVSNTATLPVKSRGSAAYGAGGGERMPAATNASSPAAAAGVGDAGAAFAVAPFSHRSGGRLLGCGAEDVTVSHSRPLVVAAPGPHQGPGSRGAASSPFWPPAARWVRVEVEAGGKKQRPPPEGSRGDSVTVSADGSGLAVEEEEATGLLAGFGSTPVKQARALESAAPTPSTPPPPLPEGEMEGALAMPWRSGNDAAPRATLAHLFGEGGRGQSELLPASGAIAAALGNLGGTTSGTSEPRYASLAEFRSARSEAKAAATAALQLLIAEVLVRVHAAGSAVVGVMSGAAAAVSPQSRKQERERRVQGAVRGAGGRGGCGSGGCRAR